MMRFCNAVVDVIDWEVGYCDSKSPELLSSRLQESSCD